MYQKPRQPRDVVSSMFVFGGVPGKEEDPTKTTFKWANGSEHNFGSNPGSIASKTEHSEPVQASCFGRYQQKLDTFGLKIKVLTNMLNL